MGRVVSMQSVRAQNREAKAPPSVRSDAGLVWRFVWAIFSDEELVPYMLRTDKDGLKREALERALTDGRGPEGGGAGIHWTFNKEWTKQFNGTKILRHKGQWLVPVILEANYDPAGVEQVPEVRKDFNSAWPLVEENELLLRPGARLSIEKAWVALPDYADWSKGGQQLQEALDGVGNHWLPDGRELETRLTPVSISRRDVTAGSHRTSTKFSPSQMQSWESLKPWNLSPVEAEGQLVDGWWAKSARGSEAASWEKGYIRPSPEFFTFPEEVRRGIAYHEAGHAMIEAAGGIAAVDPDPLRLLDLPGGSALGYNAEEIIAEAYAALWCDPQWFGRSNADEIHTLVVAMARKAGFPLPSGSRTATSWRGLVNGPVWTEYPGVILVDKTGGGRQSYELYVDGRQIGRAQRLDEAKAAIEAKIGPCEFRRLPQQPVKTEHYWFGTQDWFGDPSIVYAAIPV